MLDRIWAGCRIRLGAGMVQVPVHVRAENGLEGGTDSGPDQNRNLDWNWCRFDLGSGPH